MENEKCSLCFDCYNATGGCSWSKFLIPVKGWVAEKTSDEYGGCYRVDSCPQFARDAFEGGQTRATNKELYERHASSMSEPGLEEDEDLDNWSQGDADNENPEEARIKIWAS